MKKQRLIFLTVTIILFFITGISTAYCKNKGTPRPDQGSGTDSTLRLEIKRLSSKFDREKKVAISLSKQTAIRLNKDTKNYVDSAMKKNRSYVDKVAASMGDSSYRVKYTDFYYVKEQVETIESWFWPVIAFLVLVIGALCLFIYKLKYKEMEDRPQDEQRTFR
ncbi:MAG TPA: hypothetical protein VFE57_01525, partial [Cyclobacteriaceae bacterium]|nr:hypothetical protein [Cyclobacteriaceae bacterium]